MNSTKQILDFKDNKNYQILAISFAPFLVSEIVTRKIENKNISMLIRIGAILLGYYIAKGLFQEGKEQKESLTTIEDVKKEFPYLKIGDKGTEISDFQDTVNLLWGQPIFEQKGNYDKKTKEYISVLLKDTTGLKNPETGEVRVDTLKDFSVIIKNIKKE